MRPWLARRLSTAAVLWLELGIWGARRLQSWALRIDPTTLPKET